jgi:hypothetical protein
MATGIWPKAADPIAAVAARRSGHIRSVFLSSRRQDKIFNSSSSGMSSCDQRSL